jgi:cobaltochelatase CobN
MILQHAQPGQAEVQPLTAALLGELRGRFLNPNWLKPLMGHGYAGARTMGQEFLENLWGWQVTRPDLVKNWAWDEVKSVYFDDAHKLGLPAFLGDGHNAQVKAHMLAIFMVAAEKGFWQTDAATVRRLGGELARLVAKNGLPGSGHTAPNHPMWDWLAPRLDSADAAALGVTLAKARGDVVAPTASPTVNAPGKAKSTTAKPASASEPATAEAAPPARYYELDTLPPPAPALLDTLHVLLLLAGTLALFTLGLWRGRQLPAASRRFP